MSYTTLTFNPAYNSGNSLTLFNVTFTSTDGGLTYTGSPTSITNGISYNQSLTGIKIGNIVTTIVNGALKNCTYLSSVTFETGCQLQTLGEFIFEGDTSLLSFTFPASVNNVYPSMFSQCYNLSSINVDPANVTYSSSNGILFSKDGKTLVLFPYTPTSYMVPNTVITINTIYFWDNFDIYFL